LDKPEEDRDLSFIDKMEKWTYRRFFSPVMDGNCQVVDFQKQYRAP